MIAFILSQLHIAASLRSEPRDDLPEPKEDFCRTIQSEESVSTPVGEDGNDGMFQDARLIGSFVLGIAFMHAMEVLKPGQGGAARKFELYPYVL